MSRRFDAGRGSGEHERPDGRAGRDRRPEVAGGVGAGMQCPQRVQREADAHQSPSGPGEHRGNSGVPQHAIAHQRPRAVAERLGRAPRPHIRAGLECRIDRDENRRHEHDRRLTSIATAAPAIAPASAGPTTNERFRLDASIALAWSSSSGPAISAIAPKKWRAERARDAVDDGHRGQRPVGRVTGQGDERQQTDDARELIDNHQQPSAPRDIQPCAEQRTAQRRRQHPRRRRGAGERRAPGALQDEQHAGDAEHGDPGPRERHGEHEARIPGAAQEARVGARLCERGGHLLILPQPRSQ